MSNYEEPSNYALGGLMMVKTSSETPSNYVTPQRSRKMRGSRSTLNSTISPQKELPFNSEEAVVHKKEEHAPETSIHCKCAPDLYTRVLGPTADESFLTGLQTVVDLYTKLRVCGDRDEREEAPSREQDIPERDVSPQVSMQLEGMVSQNKIMKTFPSQTDRADVKTFESQTDRSDVKASKSQTDRSVKNSKDQTEQNIISAGFQVKPYLKSKSSQTMPFPEMVSAILQTVGLTPEMVSKMMQTSGTTVKNLNSILMQTASPDISTYAMQTSEPQLNVESMQTSEPKLQVEGSQTGSELLPVVELKGDEHKCICPPEPPSSKCKCCTCSSSSLNKGSKSSTEKEKCVCCSDKKCGCDGAGSKKKKGKRPNGASHPEEDDRPTPAEVKYAVTKISRYKEFTVFEVMKSTKNQPRQIPKGIEGVFVLKKKNGSGGDVSTASRDKVNRKDSKKGVNGDKNGDKKSNGAKHKDEEIKGQ